MQYMKHYSDRLGRDFEDTDLLTRREVAQVLSINAGREIDEKRVTDMVARGIFQPALRVNARKLLYRYGDIKNYVISQKMGRHREPNPSKRALQKRAADDRRRRGEPRLRRQGGGRRPAGDRRRGDEELQLVG